MSTLDVGSRTSTSTSTSSVSYRFFLFLFVSSRPVWSRRIRAAYSCLHKSSCFQSVQRIKNIQKGQKNIQRHLKTFENVRNVKFTVNSERKQIFFLPPLPMSLPSQKQPDCGHGHAITAPRPRRYHSCSRHCRSCVLQGPGNGVSN